MSLHRDEQRGAFDVYLTYDVKPETEGLFY